MAQNPRMRINILKIEVTIRSLSIWITGRSNNIDGVMYLLCENFPLKLNTLIDAELTQFFKYGLRHMEKMMQTLLQKPQLVLQIPCL